MCWISFPTASEIVSPCSTCTNKSLDWAEAVPLIGVPFGGIPGITEFGGEGAWSVPFDWGKLLGVELAVVFVVLGANTFGLEWGRDAPAANALGTV